MRFVVCLLLSLTLMACEAQEKRIDVDQLQRAVKRCGDSHTERCQSSRNILTRLTVLARELTLSPQGFGQKILQLQLSIEKNKRAIASYSKGTAKDDDQLKTLIKRLKYQQNLSREYMAVLRWLEAPKG